MSDFALQQCIMMHRIGLVLLSFLVVCCSTFAQPINVQGITDRTPYTGSASFSVPTLSGFSYQIRLDGRLVPADVTNVVTQAEYHELVIIRQHLATQALSNRVVRFLVRALDRGTTEDGLQPWVPYPTINSSAAELAGSHLEIMTPAAFPVGMEIPVIAWIRNAQDTVVRGNGLLTSSGHPSIPLRRGVGSGFLAANNPSGPLQYTGQLPGIQSTKTINVEAGTVWTSVSGTLSGDTVWGADARIAVTGHITIPAGSTLRILDGAIVRLNAGVNIISPGRIGIEGTAARPVVFTPVTRAQPWGGFFITNTTSQLDATAAIFASAGAAQSGFPGHRPEQPLFMLDNRVRVALTNCAAIYLAGQFHHSFDRGQPYATMTVVDSLIQRCTTAGEFNGCSLTLHRSALIEVPYEDPFYCADPDCDHDGFYLNAGIHELRDSLIGWLKDDSADAGSGGGPSTVTVSNCWIEGSFHEGLAWSGGNRTTRTFDTVLINNGQGIECGWSEGNNSPLVFGTRLLSLANSIGARFGDNYDTIGSGLNGFLTVTNSILLHNYRDAWGVTFRNDANGWFYRTNQMLIQNNFITVPNPHHPSNQLWQPAQDGPRLAAFMTTPANAAVGVSIATWSNQIPMALIFNGVPVRLSSFTTNPVSVDYAFESSGSPLATGTLTFTPGETVKRFFPSGFDLQAYSLIQAVVRNPLGGDLTGVSNVTFQGSTPAPQIFPRVVGNQPDIARLGEGLPLALTAPSAQSVSVNYQYETADGPLGNGSVVFQPGETLAWTVAPGVNPLEFNLVRLTLSDPSAAVLLNPTSIYYVKTDAAPVPASATFIPRGGRWKYLDTGVDPGVGWRTSGFNDVLWPSGFAQLGFGESDQMTIIADNNQITTYFRILFNVENPLTFTNLSMWMLRDDAGVVWLNGTEAYRSPNLPAPPAVISHSTLTLAPNGENTIDMATLSRNFLISGNNLAAVEIHQQAPDSSDVSFDFELIGNPVPSAAPPQNIYWGDFAGQLTLAWSDPAFILQRATDVAGPWTNIVTRSPFVVIPDPGVAQTFFRLRKP